MEFVALNSQIANLNLELTKTGTKFTLRRIGDIGRGQGRYKITLDPRDLLKPRLIIGKYELVPFYWCVDSESFERLQQFQIQQFKQPHTYSGRDSFGLLQIIRVVFRRYFDIEVDSISIVKHSDMDIIDVYLYQKHLLGDGGIFERFHPSFPEHSFLHSARHVAQMERHDTNDESGPIYANEDMRCEFLRKIPPVSRFTTLFLAGGDLAYDSLVWLALSQLKISDVTILNDIPFINNYEQSQDVRNHILQLRKEHCFSSCVSVHNLNDIDYVRELAHSFEYEVLPFTEIDEIKQMTGCLFLKPRPSISGTIENPEEWFSESVARIICGMGPIVYLTGKWVNLLEPTLENRLKISYLTHMVTDREFTVLADLCVAITVFSWEELELCQNSIEANLNVEIVESKEPERLKNAVPIKLGAQQFWVSGPLQKPKKSPDIISLHGTVVLDDGKYYVEYLDRLIPLPHIKDPLSVVERKWKNGEYLSPWAFNYFRQTGNLSAAVGAF